MPDPDAFDTLKEVFTKGKFRTFCHQDELNTVTSNALDVDARVIPLLVSIGYHFSAAEKLPILDKVLVDSSMSVRARVKRLIELKEMDATFELTEWHLTELLDGHASLSSDAARSFARAPGGSLLLDQQMVEVLLNYCQEALLETDFPCVSILPDRSCVLNMRLSQRLCNEVDLGLPKEPKRISLERMRLRPQQLHPQTLRMALAAC